MIRSADGTNIAYEETGSARMRPVVLLHGFGQSRAIWRPLLEAAIASELRFVAVDLRGHGDSDKPESPDAYRNDQLGEDVDAVIRHLDLKRPILVGWSYGGVPLGEYLRRHGDGALGGLLLAAASIRLGRDSAHLFGPTMMENARGLMSGEGMTYEKASQAFLEGCANRALPNDFTESALVAMRRVPQHVRRAYLTRGDDFSREIAAAKVPITLVHGEADQVVLPAMSEHIGKVALHARYVELADVGHVPWIEAPDAFHHALRDLAGRATTFDGERA